MAPRSRVALVLLALTACGELPRGTAPDDPASLEQLLSVCTQSATLPGIDVSGWQGTINWPQVAGAGIKFGYTKATEGTGFVDSTFATNWAGMRANGIARGAYHFFHPGTDGKAQADHYLAAVGTLGAGDLPPMLDWEVSDGVSGATAAASAQAFINEITARTGMKTVIYTSPGLWSGFGVPVSFAAEPLWVAHYLFCTTGAGCCPTVPSGWSSYVAWQWSDKGSVPGISGNVDLDVFNGDAAALAAFGGVACTNPLGHPVGGGGPLSGLPCSGAAPAPAASTSCGHLSPGQGLNQGQHLTSCDGRFELVMQSDGNLVEYVAGKALWATSTNGNGQAVVMQGDGNLVVYSSGGCASWASATSGHSGATLALQDDGNLVLYDSASHALWSSGSGPLPLPPTACGAIPAGKGLAPGDEVAACGGCFKLTMQTDGNLVLYRNTGAAVWDAHTAGSSAVALEMQSDGDAVLYSKAGCPLFSTASGGHAGARLAVQDDGNLVVYSASNAVLWASNSVACAGGCSCTPPPPPPPPPVDAGTPPVVAVDAGTSPVAVDAGAPQTVDAGHPQDAGFSSDGGELGQPDAGPHFSDAGSTGPDDAGAPPAGPPTPGASISGSTDPVVGSCGCTGAPTNFFPLALLLRVIFRRRGGRNSPPTHAV